MFETRMAKRFRMAGVQCFIETELIPREVFNMSMGGLLIEKASVDNTVINKTYSAKLIANGQEITVKIQVIRSQERSLGAKFYGLTEKQVKFLNRLLIPSD